MYDKVSGCGHSSAGTALYPRPKCWEIRNFELIHISRQRHSIRFWQRSRMNELCMTSTELKLSRTSKHATNTSKTSVWILGSWKQFRRFRTFYLTWKSIGNRNTQSTPETQTQTTRYTETPNVSLQLCISIGSNHSTPSFSRSRIFHNWQMRWQGSTDKPDITTANAGVWVDTRKHSLSNICYPLLSAIIRHHPLSIISKFSAPRDRQVRSNVSSKLWNVFMKSSLEIDSQLTGGFHCWTWMIWIWIGTD